MRDLNKNPDFLCERKFCCYVKERLFAPGKPMKKSQVQR